MPPLQLSAAEARIIKDAALPVAPRLRPAFVERVLTLLAGHDELGDGLVHRTCREAQREFVDAPNLDGTD